MLCVDSSSRSSYLKNFFHRGCFLHRWWTVVDLCRLFTLWSGLRLKFQDHCDFVNSVCNWLFWLERAFMVFWYIEYSFWNLGRFCVSRRSIHLFKCSKYSLCVFLQFGFAPLHSLDCRAPTWVHWIVCGNGCLWLFSFDTIFVLNCVIFLLWCTGSDPCPPIPVLYFLLLRKTCPAFFFLFINDKHIVLLKNNSLLFSSKIFISKILIKHA